MLKSNPRTPVLSGPAPGGSVSYTGVRHRTNVRYVVSPWQVKGLITVRSPAAPRRFTFEIRDPQHLLGWPERSAMEAYRFTGRVRPGIGLTLAAPTAWSTRRPGDRVPGSAHQQVSRTSSGYRFTLRLDSDWLAEQSYPIVVDPTMIFTAAGRPGR